MICAEKFLKMNEHEVHKRIMNACERGTIVNRPSRVVNGMDVLCLEPMRAECLRSCAACILSRGYVLLLSQFSTFSDIFRNAREQMERVPNLRLSYAVMAIGFAPFAEEFLFRGLLFRALDREWGGWRAIVGSAAFFAIYHPPLAWLPVFLVGVTTAFVFKKPADWLRQWLSTWSITRPCFSCFKPECAPSSKELLTGSFHVIKPASWVCSFPFACPSGHRSE
jgi:hypothetical protein